MLIPLWALHNFLWKANGIHIVKASLKNKKNDFVHQSDHNMKIRCGIKLSPLNLLKNRHLTPTSLLRYLMSKTWCFRFLFLWSWAYFFGVYLETKFSVFFGDQLRFMTSGWCGGTVINLTAAVVGKINRRWHAVRLYEPQVVSFYWYPKLNAAKLLAYSSLRKVF